MNMYFAKIFNHTILKRTLEKHGKNAAKPKTLPELLYEQESCTRFLPTNHRYVIKFTSAGFHGVMMFFKRKERLKGYRNCGHGRNTRHQQHLPTAFHCEE